MAMNKTSILANNILTTEGWLSDQLLTIEDGIITSISTLNSSPDSAEQQSPTNDLKTKIPADCKVNYLIPGMPNMHSHGFQWALSGLAENYSRADDSFWSWRQLMYKFLQILQPEDLEIIAQALYVDMLKSGYTSVGEFHYLHNDCSGSPFQQKELLSITMIEAALKVGISICHLPVLYQYAGFNKQLLEKNQQRFFLSNNNFITVVENLRQQYQHHSMVNIGFAPHSLRAVDIENLVEIEQLLAKDKPVHIHISEQKLEVDSCITHFNKRPVELLYEKLDIDHKWSLIHATHTDENEIRLMANSDATVGLCITTEANLGDGFFNMDSFSKSNGSWGIGSDSHISIDAVEELRWLEYGQRLQLKQRACYASENKKNTSQNLYLDAVKGGAKSLGFKQGDIAVGEKADFVSLTVPYCYQELTPEQILSKWIFSKRENWIESVMVSGCWVVKNKQHILDDFLRENYAKILNKILSNC